MPRNLDWVRPAVINRDFPVGRSKHQIMNLTVTEVYLKYGSEFAFILCDFRNRPSSFPTLQKWKRNFWVDCTYADESGKKKLVCFQSCPQEFTLGQLLHSYLFRSQFYSFQNDNYLHAVEFRDLPCCRSLMMEQLLYHFGSNSKEKPFPVTVFLNEQKVREIKSLTGLEVWKTTTTLEDNNNNKKKS